MKHAYEIASRWQKSVNPTNKYIILHFYFLLFTLPTISPSLGKIHPELKIGFWLKSAFDLMSVGTDLSLNKHGPRNMKESPFNVSSSSLR